MEYLDKKEFNIFELISVAIGIFKDNALTFAMLVMTVFFPVAVLLEMLSQYMNLELLSLDIQSMLSNEAFLKSFISLPQIIYYSFWILIQVIAAPLLTMAAASAVKTALKGEKTDYKKAAADSISHGPSLILAAVFTFLLTSIGYMTFVFPGIYFSVIFHFFVYAIILNDMKALDAVFYSKSLVKGRWMRVLFYAFIFYTVNFGFSISLNSLFFILGGNFAAGVLTTMLGAFINSFFYVINTVWFLNIEHFKKGGIL